LSVNGWVKGVGLWIGIVAAILQIAGIGSVFVLVRHGAKLFPADRAITPLGITLLVFAVVSLTLGVGGLLFLALGLVQRRLSFPRLPYRLLDAHYKLVVGVDHIDHVVALTLRMTQHGVRYFEGRYSWTGDSPPPPFIVARPAGATLINAGRQSPWTYYQVFFRTPLHRDEKVQVELRQSMSKEDFLPLISKTVVEEIGRLTLEVVFEDGRRLAQVSHNKLRGSFDSFPVNQQHVILGSGGEASHAWVVEKPGRGRVYQMTWVLVDIP
jgi:hypothetical protein